MLDGRKWAEFCDTLKDAGSVVLADTVPMDPQDRTEGCRYLTRLTRGRAQLLHGDLRPRGPVLHARGRRDHQDGDGQPGQRLSRNTGEGRRSPTASPAPGAPCTTSASASQAGGYAKTGSLDTTGYLEASDLVLDADGRFEIIASVDATTRCRQLAADGARDLHDPGAPDPGRPPQRGPGPGEHRDGSTANPRRGQITPERLEQLARTRSCSSSQATSQLVRGMDRGLPPGAQRAPQVRSGDSALAAGGDPNIAYYHGWFELAEDEALVIDITPPECDFWNFQLANYWLESLDYRYFPVHLNQGTATYRPDGSVRIVVATTDPGVPNWIDTCGHRHGTMCVRWVGAVGASGAPRRGGEALGGPAVSAAEPGTDLLDLEDLLDEARRSAGLEDFGDDDFREGLSVLLETYDTNGYDEAGHQPAAAAGSRAARRTPAHRARLGPAPRDPRCAHHRPDVPHRSAPHGHLGSVEPPRPGPGDAPDGSVGGDRTPLPFPAIPPRRTIPGTRC